MAEIDYCREFIFKISAEGVRNGERAVFMGRCTGEEIIRCRNCKNWDKTWTNDFPPNHHYCLMVDGVREDNFYCADAERCEE